MWVFYELKWCDVGIVEYGFVFLINMISLVEKEIYKVL